MDKVEEIKNAYKALREELDAEIIRLEKQHQKHLACKKGCDLCCMNFSVFPIEFEVIREEVGGRFLPVNLTEHDENQTPASCVFLKNHLCSIYNSRPFICRTHGLPLLYMNNDEWELSHCELNFTKAQEDYFEEENTFLQDKWNSRLFMLNREFISLNNTYKYSDIELIPLSYLNL